MDELKVNEKICSICKLEERGFFLSGNLISS